MMTTWKIVPVEPSEEMTDAGVIVSDIWAKWRLMLSAAPRASEDEELVEKVARAVCAEDNHIWPEDTYNGRMIIRRYTALARAALKVLEA